MQFACMLLTLLIKKKPYSSSVCRGNAQTQIITPSLIIGFRYTTFIFNLRKVVYRKQLDSEDEILIPDQTQSLILKAPELYCRCFAIKRKIFNTRRDYS